MFNTLNVIQIYTLYFWFSNSKSRFRSAFTPNLSRSFCFPVRMSQQTCKPILMTLILFMACMVTVCTLSCTTQSKALHQSTFPSCSAGKVQFELC